MFQLWKNEILINSFENLESAQLVQSVIGGTIVALGKNNTTITGIVVGYPNYKTPPLYFKDTTNANYQLALTLGLIQRSTKKGLIGYVHS